MVTDEQQRCRYWVIPLRYNMAEIQHHYRTQNCTARIRDDLHRRISEHGRSEIEAANIDTYCKYQGMVTSISFEFPMFIASSHHDKERCKKAT